MADTASRATILAVEDDPTMLDLIGILLEDEGFRVLRATSGEDALSVLEREMPELIVSDVVMPGMDGFDLYRQVRANATWSQIPFIFLTARGERADVRRGMGLGADDYLTKPFEPEELLSAVEIRLARAREAKAVLRRMGTSLQEAIIGTLTHEFRTPLALVVGYTELLEAVGQDMSEDDFQTTLVGLHYGSQRLVSLVEDFLLLSRLETGVVADEIRLEPGETSKPDQLVRQIVEGFQEPAAAQKVVLLTDPGTPGLVLAVAPRDVAEIARRLLDNAIKFAKSEGGRVVAATRQEGAFWALEITDEGIGIRGDALDWIFEPFRQVDRKTFEQQGIGVGLTIVRGLVQAYGGQVTVESTPGEGSTFTVYLPLLSE
jgi:signal transduction histidine kinase